MRPGPTRTTVRSPSPLGMACTTPADIVKAKENAKEAPPDTAYDVEFRRRLDIEREHFVKILNSNPDAVDSLVAEVLKLPRPAIEPDPTKIEEMGAEVYATHEIAWHIHQAMHATES